jgi:hypothetical protein
VERPRESQGPESHVAVAREISLRRRLAAVAPASRLLAESFGVALYLALGLALLAGRAVAL